MMKSWLGFGDFDPNLKVTFDKYYGANSNLKIACMHLINEFGFWKVHGIMNTSGLLQSKWSPNFARDLK